MNIKDDTGVFDGTAMGGVAYTTGRHGSAFLFNGTSGVVTADPLDYLYPPASMSAEAWIATHDTDGSIIEKYDCGGSDACSGSYWALYLQDGHPVFGLRVDGSPTNVIVLTASLSVVDDGAWHHLVGVRDVTAQKLLLYVDGTLAVSVPISGADLGPINNADAKPDVLTIGAGRKSGVDTFISFFAGAVDDAAFYTHAMTADEVAAIFNAPDGVCP